MPYALQSLLRIRALREERAGGELTLARQAVAVARDALDARRRERRARRRRRSALGSPAPPLSGRVAPRTEKNEKKAITIGKIIAKA